MRKLGYVLALGCLLAGANGAFAGLAPVGDPIEIGSWAQAFNETGVGQFDAMVLQIVSGGPFEAPAFRDLATGWTTTDNATQTAAWASGPDSGNMTFNIWFQGGSSSPLTFNFWALHDGKVLEGAQAYWNGGGWAITPLAGAAPAADPIPEPLTMASAFLAIAGLGGYIRRRTSRAAA